MLQVNGLSSIVEKEPMKIVDWSQGVENNYTGSPCGCLDQVMILFAKDGMGTHYNPTTRAVSHHKFGGDSKFRLLVLDTGTTRHGLETSTYSVFIATS